MVREVRKMTYKNDIIELLYKIRNKQLQREATNGEIESSSIL